MRDINRIEPFMEEVTRLWKTKCPDMRFGQFMCNVLGEVGAMTHLDPFYFEDDKMLSLIKEISWLK